MPHPTTPAVPTTPSNPFQTPTGVDISGVDINSILGLLDLSNPALAQLVRSGLLQTQQNRDIGASAAQGLSTAIPPAGQYTTSGDYQTLSKALEAQYIASIISDAEKVYGPLPQLQQQAVAAGLLTPEEASTLISTPPFTQVGTLQQKFGGQGGLRAVEGPYAAALSQGLTETLNRIAEAKQKADSDAYQLALAASNSRITALTNSGQLGINLPTTLPFASNVIQGGVSRRNAQDARAAAEAGAGGPPEMPGFNLPTPPTPTVPNPWAQALPGLVTAIGAAGAKGLFDVFARPATLGPQMSYGGDITGVGVGKTPYTGPTPLPPTAPSPDLYQLYGGSQASIGGGYDYSAPSYDYPTYDFSSVPSYDPSSYYPSYDYSAPSYDYGGFAY